MNNLNQKSLENDINQIKNSLEEIKNKETLIDKSIKELDKKK